VKNFGPLRKSVMMAHCLPSLWPGFNSISRDFSLAGHTLPTRPEPAWQKMAQSPLSDTAQSVDSEEEGRSPTMNRRWLIERKISSKMAQIVRPLFVRSCSADISFVYRRTLTDKYIDTYIDTCIDTFIDTFIDTYIDTYIDT